MKKQFIIAISGVKNSGKTTLIKNIIPSLVKKGYKVATVKHDGHDFEPDVPNTDTYNHRKSGAYGVGIFSNNRFMVTKEIKVEENELISLFPEADIIILEGFKNSEFLKIEIVRSSVSLNSVCSKNILGYVTDLDLETDLCKFELDDYEKIASVIEKLYLDL